MIINKKAKELLEKLRRTNYKQLPDFGLDATSEMLIQIISNECKSTLLETDYEGNLQSRRYGSDIIKENMFPIIRQLIINGGTIPKEVMNKIMYSDGMIRGVNFDIQLYKGIQEQEDGTLTKTATLGKVVIDFRSLDAETLKIIEQEVYSRYARQFVLSNAKQLPPTSKFSIFREKMLHGREDRDFISKKFTEILKTQTEYGDEIIAATVQYHLEHMYNNKFKNSILQTMNNGNGLVPLDAKGKKLKFEHLQNAILAETQDIENVIPDINQIHEDIEQLYADVEAQLIAYSTDITRTRCKAN